MQGMAGVFVSAFVSAAGVPWQGLPVAPVVAVVQPRARQLQGWKEITAACKAAGHPYSERHLYDLAVADPSCPIYAPAVGKGNVVAVDQDLVAWLRRRLVPLGMRKLSELKKSPTKKRRAK